MNTKNVISEIEESIKVNYKTFTSMGVVNGLAGVSLLYYYLGDNDKCFYFLEKSINGLNEEYQGTDIVGDIIDIGKLLDFYVSKEKIVKEDVTSFFENYDPIIAGLLIDSLKNDNINPITGTLKYANYFINRSKYTDKDYRDLLLPVLDKIENLAIEDKKTKGIFWTSTIQREERYLVELGIKHGIMGIVDFLVSLYTLNIDQDRVLTLIKKSMVYLSNKKLENDKFLFPFCTDEVEDAKSFSLSLNYGDLGIAYGIYRVINSCGLKKYENLLVEILLNTSKFKDDDNKFITDANLFYGCLGLSSLLAFFNNKLSLSFLKETINYWYLKTVDHKIHKNKWAGFDTTFNKFDANAQLSLSHGVVGIGIALINHEKKMSFDFLNFLGYNV